MKTIFSLIISLCLTAVASAQEKFAVATLHPVLTDLVTQISGENVTVHGLLRTGADIHAFSPSPADIKMLRECKVVFASGKHLETYLDKLKDNLTAAQRLVEVGRNIPSITIDAKDSAFACCPTHAAGAIDPHWWNGLENMKRAADVVAEALATASPTQKELFTKNAKAWQADLDTLKSWAKKEISQIPAKKRVLATNHLALTYFAKEFGFKLLPVQGLNTQTKPTASDVATAAAKIKELGVGAIYPEVGSNLRHVEEIQKETGTKLGKPLVMDMNAVAPLNGFREAFRSNVAALVEGLK